MSEPSASDVHVPATTAPGWGQGPKPKARLVNLDVREVSSVDHPANKRTWLVVKQAAPAGAWRADVGEPTKKADVVTTVIAGMRALAGHLGLAPEVAKQVEAELSAPSFQASLMAATLDDLREDLGDAVCALMQTILACCAAGGDVRAAVTQAVTDFATYVDTEIADWVPGTTMKIGRKISADRLTRMTTVRDMLTKMIEEGMGPMADMKTEPDKTTKIADPPPAAEPTGTLDEVLKARFAAMEVAVAKADARAAAAEAFAQAQAAEVQKRDAVQKAASFRHLPINPDDDAAVIGSLLKAQRGEPLTPEELMAVGKRTFELFSAADALVAQGGAPALYHPIGSAAGGDAGAGDAWSRLQTLAQTAVTKAAGTLTEAKALSGVLKTAEGQALYAEYLRQHPQQIS